MKVVTFTDVAACATLVGMLKGTAYYNPVMNPDRAEQRRNTVMAQMVKRGDLAEAEFDRAIQLDGGLGNAWLGRGLCRVPVQPFADAVARLRR